MISYALGVEDLADTRFAISALHETVLSLRVLREPGLRSILLPWRRFALSATGSVDTGLLLAIVGPRLGLPDFLTPRPTTFAADFAAEIALVRRTPVDLVRRDIRAVYLSRRLPEHLRAVDEPGDSAIASLREEVCDLLEHYWQLAVLPLWPQMRLVLEADTTYRARQLALGGARLLFANMHPHLRWEDGVLHISHMISQYHVAAAGRGLLLIPSIFAHKPAPPVTADEPPLLSYPSRGVATLWAPPPTSDAEALAALI